MKPNNLLAFFLSLVAFFAATVHAAGQELASKDELYTGKEFSNAFANPKDNPDLPNVLLIGDSISIGYTVDVRKLLSGKADVFRIPTNGRTAAFGCKKLDQWIGQRKWDVIHFNWGLWDICYRSPQSKAQGRRDKINGTLTASPDQYRSSLEQAVAKLKQTGAKLIWCSTTPVPEFEVGRKVGDEIKYNLIAESIMKQNRIPINDLHAHALLGLPDIQAKKGDVHFNAKGYAYLAKQVAKEISSALAVKNPKTDAAKNAKLNPQKKLPKNRRRSKSPNVLVFVVDDLGYMDIGANNPNCFYETPNVDCLSASALRFTDGYAANPVCSPTRYSLMTGKYPTRVRATNFFSGKLSGKFNPAPLNNNMPLEEITIAEALKEKGYATFFAGKWHLGEQEKFLPQNQGFDINVGGYGRGGPYSGKKYFAPFKNPQIAVESPAGDHLPDRLARETAKFIDANKEKPFLAYLSFYSVHTPLMGRPDLVKKYKQKASSIQGTAFAEEEQVLGKRPRRVRILQNHAVYAAMVEAMDEAVGKVLKQLDDSGVAENTIVIFTSDNGGLSTSEGLPTSNLPLRGGKGWVYEGGIREPWIVRYPGVTVAGSQSAQPISSIDLFPTIAAAAGIETQHKIDGIDLRPALEGKSLDREALYWHYPHYSNQGGIPGGAIRMGDYKLVERYEDGRVHLYDLKKDVGEQQDLADKMPQRVARMRRQLHDWYQSVDAQFLQEKNGNIPWAPKSTTEKPTSQRDANELLKTN